MNKNLELFLTFMKIGAFTFGGGYAMIPLIQKEVCENKKWLNEKEISDIINNFDYNIYKKGSIWNKSLPDETSSTGLSVSVQARLHGYP